MKKQENGKAAGQLMFGFDNMIVVASIGVIINIVSALNGPYKDITGAYILLSSLPCLAGIYILYKKQLYDASKIAGAALFNILFLTISIHLGLDAGVYLYYFPFTISYIFLFREGGSKQKAFVYFAVTSFFLILIFIICPDRPKDLTLPESAIHNIYHLSLVVSFLLTSYLFYTIYNFQQSLSALLLEKERKTKQEIIRSVIEAQEEERVGLVEELQESVYQTLATEKLMLQDMVEKESGNGFLKKSLELTNEAMNELYSICYTLNPATVRDIGLEEGLHEYIAQFSKQFEIRVELDGQIELLEKESLSDKLSIFRIVQDYLIIHSGIRVNQPVSIVVEFNKPILQLKFLHPYPEFEMTTSSHILLLKDFNNRLEYYQGNSESKVKGDYRETLLQLHIAKSLRT